MKSLFKLISLLFMALVLLAPASSAFEQLAQDTGINSIVLSIAALAVVIGLALLNQKDATYNYFTAGIQVEMWAKYIIQRFWKDNGFIKKAYNDDQYVLAGKVVHIPQPGTAPVVVVNRSSLPATAVKRTDTDITYSLDEYTTTPSILPDADKAELSYDKMNDLYGDHAGTLSETVADGMLIKWAPSTILGVQQATTGDAVAPVGVQTGNRKGFSAADLKAAMIKMNVQKVPKQGRVALIDDNMYSFFLDSLNTNQMAAYQQTADLKNGVVGRLYGFDIMTRPTVLQYTTAGVVNALGAAGAVDDNLASLCYHPDSVARALGEVKFFEHINNPLYYGDLYSALIRGGGRIRRSGGEGVIAIIQAASA